MSTTNQTPEQEVPVTPEKDTANQKNPNALLRYITILFAVAFLVVLLSLLISTQQSKDTITALNQTSASALENAEELQERNRALSDTNAALHEQIIELEQQVSQAEEATQQAQAQTEEAQTLQQDTVAAYELLFAAMDARQSGNSEAFAQVMPQLAEAKDLLTGKALTRCNELMSLWEKTEEE